MPPKSKNINPQAGNRMNKKKAQTAVHKASSSTKGMVKKEGTINYQTINNNFEMGRTSKDGSILIKGTDYLGLSTGNSEPNYRILFNYQVNPLAGLFEGTRLQNLARNFDKYLFTRLRFHLQSGTPTSVGGSYVSSFDRDISDPLPSLDEAGVRRIMASSGARNASISSPCTIDIPLADTQDFYYTNYTGDDPRLAYQGRFIAMNTTPITSNFSLCAWVEYEILLMDPSFENLETFYTSNMRLINGTQTSALNNLFLDINSKGSTGTRPPLSTVTTNSQVSDPSLIPSSLNPVLQGFDLATGCYILEQVLTITNNSTATSNGIRTFCSVIPKISSAIAEVKATLSGGANTFLNNYTAPGGEPGYATAVQASGATNNTTMKWAIKVPPGGATVTPVTVNPSDANPKVAYGGQNNLTKISPQQYAAFL